MRLHGIRKVAAKRLHAAGLYARGVRRKLLSDRRFISRYLDTHAVRRLQIGTGPNPIPGWLNTDVAPDTYRDHRANVVYLDATRRFPFEDGTFESVFSEHQIEHISEAAALDMVRECFRVLRPGGRIRVATPDLAAIAGLHMQNISPSARHYLQFMAERFIPDATGTLACEIINHMFYAHGHRFIYDFETLSTRLFQAGFVDIVKHAPGESDDSALRQLEAHGRAIGDEGVNRFETMVLEGTRPGR
jgi:predicted SAM-dependent methyltransferase